MYTRKEVEKLLRNYDTMDDVKPGSNIHVRMADLRKAWYKLSHQEQLFSSTLVLLRLSDEISISVLALVRR